MLKENLPWIEKYRPDSLKDVVGHSGIIDRLRSYVKLNRVPNMLFTGSAGIGKTSSAIALAKDLFGEHYDRNFLELNASDDRGIDVVRNTIKEFARTLPFNSDYKLIFLDEADSLTADAQQALRRTMERYVKTSRFILSCNYSSRIIEPIQSRCVVFRFKPLEKEVIISKLGEIGKIEKLIFEKESLDSLFYVSQGDLRKAINILQSTASLDPNIKTEDIFKVSSRARPEEMKEVIIESYKGNFKTARELLYKLMFDYGMSGEDIIGQIYTELIDYDESKIALEDKIELIKILGETNFRITQGATERIQIEAMLAMFYLKK
ncbi:MAG: replication factor C small subunit [Candidatus ainarchaeum sp.]|nr:replication factor C small subunit [Candidatus ainarchaeum sp.]